MHTKQFASLRSSKYLPSKIIGISDEENQVSKTSLSCFKSILVFVPPQRRNASASLGATIQSLNTDPFEKLMRNAKFYTIILSTFQSNLLESGRNAGIRCPQSSCLLRHQGSFLFNQFSRSFCIYFGVTVS